MSESDLMVRAVNALTSVMVIVAVVVTHNDIKGVPRKITGACRKAVYRTLLTVFLLGVGAGEGFMVFNWLFDHGRVPGTAETMTGIGWGLLGVWLVWVRPFSKLEILCPFSKSCPAVHAQRAGGDDDECLVQLGAARAQTGSRECAGSP